METTHDPSILNAVRGYRIDFLLSPVQFTIPITINFSAQESANVNARISKFLEKGIVVKSSLEEGEFSFPYDPYGSGASQETYGFL